MMKNNISANSTADDNTLFLLVRRHNKEAFAIVYRKYHGYLYALSMRYLKDQAQAEDVVQHVFVKLWETASNINIEANLKNYLYTMTKNRILNIFRDKKEVISINYVEAQKDIRDKSDIVEDMEQRELLDLLRKGIHRLPPQKREICQIKIEEQISNQEIATRLGLSIHTVKSHYQEAIKMLRKYIK